MSRKLTPEEREVRKAELKIYRHRHYLANRERTLAVNQAYRKKNPDLIVRLKKNWADANRERLNVRRTELRRLNPEQRKATEAKCRMQPHQKARMRKYYEDNREQLIARQRERHLKNRDANLVLMRERIVKNWLKRAGWSRAEYERRAALGCEICGKKAKRGGTGGLVFDHDHDTGQVRGLLCGRCNKFLDWAIRHYEEIGCYHRLSLEVAA